MRRDLVSGLVRVLQDLGFVALVLLVGCGLFALFDFLSGLAGIR